MEEGQDKMEQSIAEQYADEIIQAENAATLAREKRKQKIKDEKTRSFQDIELGNQAPKNISEAEQFQNLGKGDIGEGEGAIFRTKKKEEEEMGNQEPYTARPKNEVDFDKEQTSGIRGYDQEQRRRAPGKLGALTLQNRAFTSNTKREITTTEQELTRLRTAKNILAGSATTKALVRWVQIVGAAYSTVILGIILTLLSIFIIPLIIIAGFIGFLPKTFKEKEMDKKIKTVEERLETQKKKMTGTR